MAGHIRGSLLLGARRRAEKEISGRDGPPRDNLIVVTFEFGLV